MKDRTLDSMDDIIKQMADRYYGTLIALDDCPNIAEEMKKYRFEDKKTNDSVVKIKLKENPMCDTITDDKINHPKHYCEGRKYEPIDIIEDWALGMHCGNAVKYISRAGRKGDAIEDLEKARWYVDRYIQKNDKFFIKLWQDIRRFFMNDFNPEPCIVAKDWNLNENLKKVLYHIAIGNVRGLKIASELLTKEINTRKEVMYGRI